MQVAEARKPRILVVGIGSERVNSVAERLNLIEGGRRFRCNFIEPGLVSYADCGGDVELLRKETIEKALPTAIGDPLTIGHVRTNRTVSSSEIHGRVDRVGYDEKTGWFFCEGTVDTDRARELIRQGQKPSCGYRVNGFGPGGVHHNIAYAQEIAAIDFHHLAIVENPRYEGADYRLNSRPNPPMKNPFKIVWQKITAAKDAGAQPTTEAAETEVGADAAVVVDGKTLRLNDLVTAHAAGHEIKPDSQIEFEVSAGKTVKVSFGELTQNYADRLNGVESPAQKEAREKLERENAVKAAADKAAEEETARKNEGEKSFKVLGAARMSTPPPDQTLEVASRANSVSEQIARGSERYGSGKN